MSLTTPLKREKLSRCSLSSNLKDIRYVFRDTALKRAKNQFLDMLFANGLLTYLVNKIVIILYDQISKATAKW